MDIKDFEIGQKVFCHSFGSWYEGTVAKIGRTRLHVTYTTGSGTTRTKAFPLNLISLEGGEGSRQRAYKEKRERKREHDEAMVGQQVMQMTENGLEPIPNTYWQMVDGTLVPMEERKTELTQVESVRLLCAFQALHFPPGFFGRHVTHKAARQIIEEMVGIRLKKSAKPPRGKRRSDNPLQDYIDWASQPEVQA